MNLAAVNFVLWSASSVIYLIAAAPMVVARRWLFSVLLIGMWLSSGAIAVSYLQYLTGSLTLADMAHRLQPVSWAQAVGPALLLVGFVVKQERATRSALRLLRCRAEAGEWGNHGDCGDGCENRR